MRLAIQMIAGPCFFKGFEDGIQVSEMRENNIIPKAAW
jgi:hypothetical protein